METNAESLKDRKEQSFGAVKLFLMISFILIFYCGFQRMVQFCLTFLLVVSVQSIQIINFLYHSKMQSGKGN